MSLASLAVSICLPVYNGETHVRECIGSILEQTFEDFELVIADNASTDLTGEMCREAAARDARVRYCPADVNRGLAWNHNRAFAVAKGRYLMWLGHDDTIGKEYVGRCFEALEQDKGAVIAYTNSNYVDKRGCLIRQVEHRNDAGSDSPNERFHNLIQMHHLCDAVFGLMRTEVLKQTRLHGAFADSDRVLLAEMGLRGRFIVLPEFLFSRRMHDAKTTSSVARFPNPRDRALLFNPAAAGNMVDSALDNDLGVPFGREFIVLLSALQRASLSLKERFHCHKHLFRWLWSHRDSVKAEIRIEVESVLRRFLSDRQISRLKVTVKRFRTCQSGPSWRTTATRLPAHGA